LERLLSRVDQEPPRGPRVVDPIIEIKYLTGANYDNLMPLLQCFQLAHYRRNQTAPSKINAYQTRTAHPLECI
jgi:hypothetical protein